MSNSAEFHQITLMVGGLKSSVDSMMGQWQRQEQEATEGRRRLHEKFEAFRNDVSLKLQALTHRVDALGAQVTVIEPSVTIFKEEKLRVEGAKRLGKVLMGALGMAAGGIGWGLHELVSYLRH